MSLLNASTSAKSSNPAQVFYSGTRERSCISDSRNLIWSEVNTKVDKTRLIKELEGREMDKFNYRRTKRQTDTNETHVALGQARRYRTGWTRNWMASLSSFLFCLV